MVDQTGLDVSSCQKIGIQQLSWSIRRQTRIIRLCTLLSLCMAKTPTILLGIALLHSLDIPRQLDILLSLTIHTRRPSRNTARHLSIFKSLPIATLSILPGIIGTQANNLDITLRITLITLITRHQLKSIMDISLVQIATMKAHQNILRI